MEKIIVKDKRVEEGTLFVNAEFTVIANGEESVSEEEVAIFAPQSEDDIVISLKNRHATIKAALVNANKAQVVFEAIDINQVIPL